MEIFQNFFTKHFVLIWCLNMLIVIGGFLFRHYRNKRDGLYFEDPDPRSVVFRGTYVSGRSYKSFMTKFGLRPIVISPVTNNILITIIGISFGNQITKR